MSDFLCWFLQPTKRKLFPRQIRAGKSEETFASVQLLRLRWGRKQNEGNVVLGILQALEGGHGEDDGTEEDEHQGNPGVFPAPGVLAEEREQEDRSEGGLGRDWCGLNVSADSRQQEGVPRWGTNTTTFQHFNSTTTFLRSKRCKWGLRRRKLCADAAGDSTVLG